MAFWTGMPEVATHPTAKQVAYLLQPKEAADHLLHDRFFDKWNECIAYQRTNKNEREGKTTTKIWTRKHERAPKPRLLPSIEDVGGNHKSANNHFTKTRHSCQRSTGRLRFISRYDHHCSIRDLAFQNCRYRWTRLPQTLPPAYGLKQARTLRWIIPSNTKRVFLFYHTTFANFRKHFFGNSMQ